MSNSTTTTLPEGATAYRCRRLGAHTSVKTEGLLVIGPTPARDGTEVGVFINHEGTVIAFTDPRGWPALIGMFTGVSNADQSLIDEMTAKLPEAFALHRFFVASAPAVPVDKLVPQEAPTLLVPNHSNVQPTILSPDTTPTP